jgi:hypothetical protein
VIILITFPRVNEDFQRLNYVINLFIENTFKISFSIHFAFFFYCVGQLKNK